MQYAVLGGRRTGYRMVLGDALFDLFHMQGSDQPHSSSVKTKIAISLHQVVLPRALLELSLESFVGRVMSGTEWGK